MRRVVPLLMCLAGLAAGIAAGLSLAPLADTEPTAEEAAPGTDDGAGPEDAARTEAAGSGAAGFVRLNNQFVVPVVRDGRVRSIVVLSLSLEMTGPNANALVFAREPRLRDAFLQVMFAHANSGGFDGRFTSTAALAPLRQGLREAARATLGATVSDVLIIDIARQDA